MRLVAGLLVSALLISGCTTGDSEPSSPSAAPQASPTQPDGPIADLNVVCSGQASPTVVLIAGLNTTGDTFESLQSDLAGTARTCWYDRAGLGSSPPIAEGADPSPGSAAADLRATLVAMRVDPPYVVLGWSYGGLVAQAYAAAYPDEVAGLVLEDTSVREQFTDRYLVKVGEQQGIEWAEGGRAIDQTALTEQLADLDLGDIPLVVLTQDAVRGKFRRVWFGHHDALVRASSDGLHVVGIGSGHVMHEDVPGLVAAAVEAAWRAAADGSALGPCDGRFTDAGGRCR